jgi:hypothetical protein
MTTTITTHQARKRPSRHPSPRLDHRTRHLSLPFLELKFVISKKSPAWTQCDYTMHASTLVSWCVRVREIDGIYEGSMMSNADGLCEFLIVAVEVISLVHNLVRWWIREAMM